VQTEVTISFLEAARGCQTPVEVTRLAHCKTCGGNGARKGTQPQSCAMCRGRGQVATRQGFLTIATECPQCRGRGQTVAHKCEDCSGRGVIKQTEMLSVNVPAGIDDGQTLRVPGRGTAGRSGGPAGHLYVTFHVEPDPRFEREGDHLITQVPITFTTAALGGHVLVPTLDGDVEVEVPAGTQPGAVHVLRGRGMPNVHGRGSGDLAMRFTISVPTHLSQEERGLLEQLQQVEQAPTSHEALVTDDQEEEGGFFFRRKKKKKR
jgi:molecular chaperone DnaJ